MIIEEVNTVCFVGAGTMGCYNALVAAVSGYEVVLYDVDAATLDQVAARHGEMAALLVGGGYCAEDAVPAALQRISLSADLRQATSRADLVSESVFERLDVKRETHRQLDEVCPPQTILTTNSSTLLVSDIEASVEAPRGERFAALHSHFGAPLVDIVGGSSTSTATIDILRRYVLSIGAVPLVLKKEYPGYVLNAMLGPVLTAGLTLVVQGVATPREVDRAWMAGGGAPMGPFGMIDLFGVNVIYDSWRFREEEASAARLRPEILSLLQPMIDSNELGMKSGRGFYSYPGPQYQQPEFLPADKHCGPLYNSLLAALIVGAVLVAAHGVAEPADIDGAWKTGTYLESGPFAILAGLGVTGFLQILAGEVTAGRLDRDRADRAATYLRDNQRQLEKG